MPTWFQILFGLFIASPGIIVLAATVHDAIMDAED